MLRWADKGKEFTFSPDRVGSEEYLGLFQQTDLLNPFSIWMLCGINGHCLDASPLAMINGGSFGVGDVSCSIIEVRQRNCSNNDDPQKTLRDNRLCSGYHEAIIPTGHYAAIPVSVHPPFMFIVSNYSLQKCSNETCFYTQCWNASKYSFAMIALVPRWVPVPVDAPNAMSLLRYKQDVGGSRLSNSTLDQEAA